MNRLQNSLSQQDPGQPNRHHKQGEVTELRSFTNRFYFTSINSYCIYFLHLKNNYEITEEHSKNKNKKKKLNVRMYIKPVVSHSIVQMHSA